ncbi:hypothetical protein V1460_10535 [Streptomyces sp. SCSIO 30461]|uniref:hypothetical protein n=1 Tax=Streptomyces sp. SCSIO 30461 TaxID=3118085 RepID=UPI0030D51BCA
MRRFFTLTALVVAATALATSASVPLSRASGQEQRPDPAGAGSIGVRLVDVPADLVDDPRARQYVIDNLKPGITIRRSIEVVNDSDSAQRIALYSGAADIKRGSFVGAAGSTGNELTSWITLSKPSLDIPAHSTARSAVTIAVPKDAAPGERYGVVWAQVRGHDTGEGIALVNRTGIRVYLSVGGNNPPQPKFEVNTMTAARDSGGRAVVQAQVHNTGGRALDFTGDISMKRVSGSLSAGPYPVRLGISLKPGQSEPVTVTVTDTVENGPWDITLRLKSGLLEETHKARITFPTGPGIAGAVPSRLDDDDAPTPILLATAAALVLLFSACLGVVRFTRRRKEP